MERNNREFGIRDVSLVLGQLEDSSLAKGTINVLSNIGTGGRAILQ